MYTSHNEILRPTAVNLSTLSLNIVTVNITHTHFKELCQDLFHNTLDPVKKVLRDSKFDKANVHDIVFEPSPSDSEAVAYGAAVQAAILSSDTSEKLKSYCF
ncbi:hypothetical protein K435DRAFT_880266 [Dendrothele bispora CBS 962.96]|uniref:Uncharacterized protein n=1 Tax=Dendrothele bispora (strain CBS 962.96) TaxID=1314807 RepID=A0A4S8KKP8_DENBC|nr:hypothetical protein K435DRAFT_880266 [Dendrothele bispora CBS 962.96]